MSPPASDEANSSRHRRGPIAWMTRNAIAANLLMLLLLGGGVWSAFAIQKEVFPQFQLDVVEVNVGYPGAAPEEVEQGILRPIEEAVRSVEGIREITSSAREGRGSVSIELVARRPEIVLEKLLDPAASGIPFWTGRRVLIRRARSSREVGFGSRSPDEW
jgi:hypothetical protein